MCLYSENPAVSGSGFFFWLPTLHVNHGHELLKEAGVATELDIKTLANMSDFEVTIQKGEEDQLASTRKTMSSNKTGSVYHDRDYIVELFEDCLYPKQIIKVEKKYKTADYSKPISLK